MKSEVLCVYKGRKLMPWKAAVNWQTTAVNHSRKAAPSLLITIRRQKGSRLCYSRYILCVLPRFARLFVLLYPQYNIYIYDGACNMRDRSFSTNDFFCNRALFDKRSLRAIITIFYSIKYHFFFK